MLTRINYITRPLYIHQKHTHKKKNNEPKENKHYVHLSVLIHALSLEVIHACKLIFHTSKGEEGLGLFGPVFSFSYASDVDLLRKRKGSLAPENGDTGGVEPAGEAGADPLL